MDDITMKLHIEEALSIKDAKAIASNDICMNALDTISHILRSWNSFTEYEQKEHIKEIKNLVNEINNEIKQASVSESYKQEIIFDEGRDYTLVSGKIGDTGEHCVMRSNGYWAAGGRRVTSYERVDKEIEYDKNGNPVKRQYSMDRQHRFWIETEDRVY